VTRLIQVGNLPVSVDSDFIKQLFAKHGPVRAARVVTRIDSGAAGVGEGFIEMESEEAGTAAIAALNHHKHEGRVLWVTWSRDNASRLADQEKMFEPMNMTHDG
jgi:RNA recognition motif-containing protein